MRFVEFYSGDWLTLSSQELIVLIMQDRGLRSALIASLSLSGESLVTLDTDPEDSAIGRIAPAPRILVMDEPGTGARLRTLAESGQWDGIIVLAKEEQEFETSGRVRILDQKYALAEVLATLTQWRAGRFGLQVRPEV